MTLCQCNMGMFAFGEDYIHARAADKGDLCFVELNREKFKLPGYVLKKSKYNKVWFKFYNISKGSGPYYQNAGKARVSRFFNSIDLENK